MIRIGVLASGRGSNFQSIIDGIKEGDIEGEIAILVTDKADAGAIERAEKNGIPNKVVLRKNFESREHMDREIRRILGEKQVDLVVLAGYMRIISPELLEHYTNKIINIHPALLPSFPGTSGTKDAFEYGVKVSGCTVHFVDGGMDTGPVIEQTCIRIDDCKTPEEVAAKILPFEHATMRKVVANFSKGEYIVEGRRVRYEGKKASAD
ncbi:phosphoribosylglycinamide formyltransferase [Candidatus Micrarchaeota archaeon]|nr:phosphoribosylglycinamide formyltransferase [Candidatus Micrarchaeota archaeon]